MLCNVESCRRSNYSVEVRLIASVWVHEWQHTGQKINQVMTAFQQRSGKSSLCRATLLSWEKRDFHTGMRNIPLGSIDQYPGKWRVLLLPITLNNHRKNPYGKDQRTWNTAFDHVWPQGPVDDVCSANIFKRTQQCWHEMTSRSMCFALRMISNTLVVREISISDECVIYRNSLIWNTAFWAWVLITRLTWETIHRMWRYGDL
jgi:hypothetical protein